MGWPGPPDTGINQMRPSKSKARVLPSGDKATAMFVPSVTFSSINSLVFSLKGAVGPWQLSHKAEQMMGKKDGDNSEYFISRPI
jgi:hypothetical protein